MICLIKTIDDIEKILIYNDLIINLDFKKVHGCFDDGGELQPFLTKFYKKIKNLSKPRKFRLLAF